MCTQEQESVLCEIVHYFCETTDNKHKQKRKESTKGNKQTNNQRQGCDVNELRNELRKLTERSWILSKRSKMSLAVGEDSPPLKVKSTFWSVQRVQRYIIITFVLIWVRFDVILNFYLKLPGTSSSLLNSRITFTEGAWRVFLVLI